MIVYVVQSGEYSGRGIEGLFSTHELAQKWIDDNSNNYNSDIEEVEVDERKDEQTLTTYVCTINYHTGSVVKENTDRDILKNGQFVRKKAQYRGYVWGCDDACVGRSTQSPEDAMKLAIELRQAELRKMTEIPWRKKP